MRFVPLHAAALAASLAVSSAAHAGAPTVSLACRYNGETVARVQFDGTDYYFTNADGTSMGQLVYQAEGRNSFVLLDGPLVGKLHMLGGQYQGDQVRLFTDAGYAHYCAPEG